MPLGFGRRLHRLRFSPVPGFSVSLLDLIFFRQNLLGTAAPLSLYGRWRQLLSPLVPAQHFVSAGLQDLQHEYPGKYDRQIMLIHCLHNVLRGGARGDAAEFGCFRGHTAIQIAETLAAHGDAATLYLFDSFQGLPKSAAPEDRCWRQGDLAADFDEVSRRFARFQDVRIVKGFFSDTLPVMPDLRIKFAHVDADLYSSIRDVNRWLLDRVVSGGIIVYDDYGFANCPGARKAVDEDLELRRDFAALYVPTGQLIAIRSGAVEP